LPWIWLEKEFLWFTKGDTLLKSKRHSKTGYICNQTLNTFRTPFEDICRFVIKHDLVISGGRRGSITVWNKFNGKQLINQNRAHLNDCNSVDCSSNNVIISGSKDTNVKVWSLHQSTIDKNLVLKCQNVIPVDDRIWTLQINDLKQQFIVGSAGCGPQKPLLLYDIERYLLLNKTLK